MAELGSLEVSLSLNADNFNNTVAQANRHIRSMGSELRSVKARGTDYEKSVEGLTKKKDILTRSVEASSLKLKEERRRYDELVASGEATEAQVERQAGAVNRAQAEYNRLSTELSTVSKELKVQSSGWTQAGEKLEVTGKKLKSVGDGMKSVGKDLTMKVSTPIAALGTGAFKMAVDFESAFAGVKKTVDASESDFKMLEHGIREMAKELPATATEIAGVAEAAGQLGIKKEDILGFTRTMIDLGESTNMTSEQAATQIARFANITGMSMDQVSNLGSTIVDLGNNSATTEGEIVALGMRIAAAGTQAGMTESNIMAISAAASSLGVEAEAGGTALSMAFTKITNAVDNGGKTLDSFAKASGMTAKDFAKAWQEEPTIAFAALLKGLNESSDAGENMSSILDDLGIKGIREVDVIKRMSGAHELIAESLNIANKAWDENTALSEEAGERYKTTESQMKMLFNQIKDIGITIGGILIPIVQDLMDKIQPWIDKFAELDEKTQKNIVVIGGLVAAIGPLILISGSLISSIGSIVSVVGAASTAMGLAGGASAIFGSALGVLSGPIGWTALGVTAIGTAAYATSKEMKKSSIEIEDWSDDVSESTAEAVGGFLKLNDKATVALNQLSWSGQVVTKDMAENIVSTINEMGNQVLSAMQEGHAEQLETMQTHFANSSALTEKEEAEIIANMQTKQAAREVVILEGQARIAEILNAAKEEKRAITEAEQQEINAIQQTMTENAIKYLTENEREQKVILENLKNEASKITAEQAAEVVRNSVKQKDEVIKEANEQYDKVVAEIIKQRDEMGTISEEQAKKLIDEAKNQRDGTIENAEKTHQNVVKEAQAQADEHVDKVDWETGKVLNKWELFKANTSKKWKEIKADASKWWSETLTDIKEKANEIKNYPSKKFDELKTVTSKKWEEIKSNITEPIRKARDFVSEKIDEIKGFFDNLKLKIPKPELPSLPKFSLTTSTRTIMGKEITYPTGFDIVWHADGGLMLGPTIFGMMGNKLLGGGEAGPEAIIPLNEKVLGSIGKAIAQTMNLQQDNKGNQRSTTSHDNSRKMINYVTIQSSDNNAVKDTERMLRRLAFQF